MLSDLSERHFETDPQAGSSGRLELGPAGFFPRCPAHRAKMPAVLSETQLSPKPSTARETLSVLRILHLALLMAVLLYIFMIRIIPAAPTEPLNKPLLVGSYALCVLELAFGQRIRSKRVAAALELLRTQPNDAKALSQWRAGVVISDSVAMSVVLYGLALHFVGGTSLQIAPFFVVGTAALLFWWPQDITTT
jgi:hypothetical protein